MRHYEVVVILDPELEERTVGKVDIWGRRRLAYEIDKKAEGIYALLDVTCSSAAVAELDRQLSLNESVLRTKVMRLDSK
jgi:small subunit ribosomal protein S6